MKTTHTPHSAAVRSYFFNELVATHFQKAGAYPTWGELRSYFAKANSCAVTYVWPQMPIRRVVCCA